MIEVHHESNEDFVVVNSKTNVGIAAFTTAYARLKLFCVLEELADRVLYYDIDSVIFLSRDGDPEPTTGPCLGQQTDEVKAGEQITTFVLVGPKDYSYLRATTKGDKCTRYHAELFCYTTSKY